jgi:hypothetical protein
MPKCDKIFTLHKFVFTIKSLTHCLFPKKVGGWKGERKESLLEFGVPPFGCIVREERKLDFGGPHAQNLYAQA